jgi:hypothetical protein
MKRIVFTFDDIGNTLALEAMRRVGLVDTHAKVIIAWTMDGSNIKQAEATIEEGAKP